MNLDKNITNYDISENMVLHILPDDDGNLYLSCDIYHDGIFDRVDFEITNRELKVCYIEAENKNSEEINCKLEKNKVTINGNELNIELDSFFQYKDNYSFSIKFNKNFNLDNINTSRYDIFEYLDEKFCIYYLKKLIKTKQLYSGYDFIYDNVNSILKFIDITAKHRIDFFTNDKNVEYSLEDCIKDGQAFLDEFNIDINIKELFDDETIILTEGFENENIKGQSLYDKEKNKKIIYLQKTNTLSMTIILIHELIHYHNQPMYNKRSMPSDFLTEATSYAYELIFLEKYLSGKYQTDAEDMYKRIINSLKCGARYIYTPVITLKMYKDNNLTIEELGKNGKIEYYFSNMKEYIANNETIEKGLWTIMGYYLGIYCFIEYKKDPKFSDKILELSNSMNTKSFMECLKIINLDSIEDVFTKGNNNLEEYTKFINNFNHNKLLRR